MDAWKTTAWLGRQVTWWTFVVFVVASLTAITAPASADPSRRVGVALIAGGAAVVVAMATDRRWWGAAAGLVVVVFGTLLRHDPDRFAGPITIAVATIAAALGLASGAWLRRRGFGWLVALAVAVLSAASGWLFVRYETELLPMGFGLIGLAASAVVATGFALTVREAAPDTGRVGIGAVLGRVGTWIELQLSESTTADDEATDVVAKLFYEGDGVGRQLIRFYALMAFASAIAALGILADSTAVVIGAMLIAPLMTPLMAVSLSLVSLWTDRLMRSVVIVVTGAMIPVAAGTILTAMLGQGVDAATNSQIVSRGNPSLLDLAIALGAGAAGAYANSRRDVSDSLPGVAVAIALVPPLAVGGAAAHLGDWDATRGALLLFVTNALAIIAMGALTFVMTGVARSAGGARGSVGYWAVAFAAFGFVVLWGLLDATSSANATGAKTSISRAVVDAWADTQNYEVVSLELDGTTVEIVLTGETPPDDDAVDDLVDRLGRLLDEVEVDLRVDLTARVVTTLD